MLFIVLEHGIEAVVVYNLFTRESDNQRLFFRPLQMIRRDQVIQERLILIRCNL